MAVKTSAVKKTAIIPEQVDKAYKQVYEQVYGQLKDTADKRTTEINDKYKGVAPVFANPMIEKEKEKDPDIKRFKSIPEPKKDSIIGQGTVGTQPIPGKPEDSPEGRYVRDKDGKIVYDTRPKKIAEEGNKQASEVQAEAIKVGKEAAGPREDPFNDFVNGEIERELNEKMAKLGSNKKATAKDIESAIKTKEKVNPNFRDQYQKAFFIKKRSEEIATKYLNDNGMAVTPENIQFVIQSQNLTQVAEIENQEEERKNAEKNKKVDLQNLGPYDPANQPILKLKKEYIDEFLKANPQYTPEEAERIADAMWKQNPKLFEKELGNLKDHSGIVAGMSMLTEDQQNKKFNSLGEAQHFIKTMYTGISDEDAKKIAEKAFKNGATPKLVMASMGGWKASRDAAAAAKAQAELELRQYNRRRLWRKVGLVSANILGAAVRGGFNIANTILNTTQKMFNAFTSPHPMSAASQAYVSAVSGASELYEVFKDMNTAFGVNDPENQYSKNLLIGTIKGAMLDKERRNAEGITIDWIRQFNDEIDALGVADPTQLTNEQSSKILNNMRNRMGQRLMDLKQKDTMNKWNMEHNGKPDAMTYSEKAELRILSSFDSQIGGELQLLNKIERAERPQNIQKRIELEKQNGVFVNVPETIDYNNIDLASSAFQTNDAYINNTILPRLRAFPTDTALSAEQKIERDALRSIVKDHNADKLRVDNIMNNLNQTIGFQINSATFNGLNGISSVDQLTEDNVRTAQINFENTYGAKLKRYNTTKTQSIAEDIEHRLLSNMEESLRKRGKDIENASNYQEKEKLNNKYQKMLSDNNISPIKVANNYIHILKPGQDPSSLYEMTYMSVKNDINTSDINGIKIDNPLYFEGSDGKRYPRPQTNEMNSYVSTLGDMVKSLEDPIQRDYIKMTNGCTDADLDYTLSELKKYKTESEVFRIENFIDGKNENDYTLFPHERYGYIPSDLKELMAGTWATDDVTVHKMIDKTDRAINYLENKNDPSLALQLRALKNLNHNLQILAWRRRYASSLSNYGISPDERKKELEEFDNIMNPFLLNYERDTMAPNSYDTKDPIHMTKFYTNFNKAGAKLTNKELEIYEKSPARKRNIGIFNLKTKDKMDEFLNIIKTEMKNAQINGAAQMEYFINKMKPILLGKPSWNFTDQTYDVEKARTAPKFENNKNITIKALGIDLKGRTKEYIENIDALSYYLATAYNDFFGTNILNGDQKIIDQRNFNKRFIDMFAEITGTIDEKARERSIKTYLRYAQNGGGNGLLHDQLQELANEDADLQRYVNGMYATHTGVSAKPIFDDKDKFISEFTRGFDPKKAKPEEKIAMQKAIATINQFFENKNQIVKNTKQMKKLLSLNADRIHNAISSTGYGLYQDTVSNYFNGVIQQHTAKNSKKTKDYIKKLAGQGLYLALNYVYTKDASKLSKSDIKMLKDLKKVIVLLDEKTVSEMIGVSSATNSQMLAYIYNNMGEIIDAIDKL